MKLAPPILEICYPAATNPHTLTFSSPKNHIKIHANFIAKYVHLTKTWNLVHGS